jgi:diadenosine tetraphosphate (Ap4A) HIT family hydrolase
MPELSAPLTANLQYAGPYRHELEQMEETNECKFCSPEFQEKKIFEWGGWIVLHNNYPATDRQGGHPAHQLLFVPIRHKDVTEPMSLSDWTCFAKLLELCKRKFGIKGICLFVRDGEPSVSGCTVRHRHVHGYEPRIGEDGKPIPIDIPAG